MMNTLEQALGRVAVFPEKDQEQIGGQLLSHLEKLRQLREDTDKFGPGHGARYRRVPRSAARAAQHIVTARDWQWCLELAMIGS
ncbi:MAG TPA: hypothetical protein VGS13_10150 [Stellaceae bacterium]|nr:hypothetical protein [Stellaceae bacterium]